LIVKRVISAKYFKKEYGKYKIIANNCEKLNIRKISVRVETEQRELINEIIKYVKKYFNKSWSSRDAENALLDFLSDFDLSILSNVEEGKVFQIVGKSPKNSKFVVSSFIKEISLSNSTIFDFITKIAQGNILANAIYYPITSKIRGYYKKTEFYFDTNVLLRALGYEGASLQKPIIELFELLSLSGAKLFCFDHTYREMDGILRACAQNFLNESIYKSIDVTLMDRNFLSLGNSASDILILANSLDKSLFQLGVRIKNIPSHIMNLRIDKSKLKERLKSEIHYRNKKARDRDIKSIDAILAIRGESCPLYLEDAKAVLVSSNTNLADVCTKYLKELSIGVCAPLIISDSILTTQIWLKRPFLSPDLPKYKIIADCYAAIQPSESIWNKYIQEANKLKENDAISEDDYILLRSEYAQSSLVIFTQNDEKMYTIGTAQKILDKIKEKIEKETEVRIMKELSSHFESDLEEKASLNLLISRQENLISRISSKFSIYLKNFILYGASILIITAYIYIIYKNYTEKFNNMDSIIILAVCLILTTGAGIINIIGGVNIKIITGRIERWARIKMETILRRYFFLNSVE